MGGRYLGFPKYIADEITLVKSGENRVAMAKHKGIVQLALEFHPSITRQLAPWEKELIENESFFKGNAHLLVPPGRGPRAQKILLRHATQPRWSPEHGMISVRVDPGESWAGLVPDQSEFPGSYNHFIGGFNLAVERPAQNDKPSPQLRLSLKEVFDVHDKKGRRNNGPQSNVNNYRHGQLNGRGPWSGPDAGPSLLTEAGARLTVMRLRGKYSPAF